MASPYRFGNRVFRSAPFATPAFLLALALAAPPAESAPLSYALGFASLPSAQGWSYAASGSHAGVGEASVFSTDGTALTQNSMGLALGSAGGSILYQIAGGITTSEPKQTLVRARCLEVEGASGFPAGQGGVVFGFSTGSVQYGFSITPTQAYVLQPSGFVLAESGLDNTGYHDWFFEFLPPSTNNLYRDGILIDSRTGGFALAANRVFFGDGTGGANARADITHFQFVQGGATDAEAASWGRVKAGYR